MGDGAEPDGGDRELGDYGAGIRSHFGVGTHQLWYGERAPIQARDRSRDQDDNRRLPRASAGGRDLAVKGWVQSCGADHPGGKTVTPGFVQGHQVPVPRKAGGSSPRHWSIHPASRRACQHVGHVYVNTALNERPRLKSKPAAVECVLLATIRDATSWL